MLLIDVVINSSCVSTFSPLSISKKLISLEYYSTVFDCEIFREKLRTRRAQVEGIVWHTNNTGRVGRQSVAD